MKKSLIKIVSFLIIISFNWFGFSRISETFANFSDTEISENVFSAGTLDFSLHSGQENFVPLQKTLNLKAGDEVNRVIQVRNEGSLSFQYTAYTEKIFGDDDFCNALQLEAVLEGAEKYSGSLMDFNFSPIEISGRIDTWHFKVLLPENSNFQNEVCQINFVFNGRQTGFSDHEKIESYFVAASSNPEGETMNEDFNEIKINEEEVSNGEFNEDDDNFIEEESVATSTAESLDGE